jgi:hypothetical protein
MRKSFALFALTIGMSSCDSLNTSSGTADSNIQDSPNNISANCSFFGQSLYESYEVLTIDHDTISIYQNGKVDKIVISGNYKTVKARRRYTEDKKSLSGHLNFMYKDTTYVIFGIEAIELSSGYKISNVRTILKGGVEEYIDPNLLDDEDL